MRSRVTAPPVRIARSSQRVPPPNRMDSHGSGNMPLVYSTYLVGEGNHADIFSQFRQDDLFDPLSPEICETVLAPTGVPAANSFESFLADPQCSGIPGLGYSRSSADAVFAYVESGHVNPSQQTRPVNRETGRVRR